MEHPTSKHEFDPEKAARGMECALFDWDPALRSIWPRMDLFDIHRPDPARLIASQLESRKSCARTYPGPRRV